MYTTAKSKSKTKMGDCDPFRSSRMNKLPAVIVLNKYYVTKLL